MSARCGVIYFGGAGEDSDDTCGGPADEICEDCDRPICLEHESRSPAGHPECPNCKTDRLRRVARDHALRERL